MNSAVSPRKFLTQYQSHKLYKWMEDNIELVKVQDDRHLCSAVAELLGFEIQLSHIARTRHDLGVRRIPPRKEKAQRAIGRDRVQLARARVNQIERRIDVLFTALDSLFSGSDPAAFELRKEFAQDREED